MFAERLHTVNAGRKYSYVAECSAAVTDAPILNGRYGYTHATQATIS